MIYHGTRPALDIHKERKFHERFGGIAQAAIEDFNLDSGIWNPNQETDNAPTECVGYTAADLLTDIFKMQFDPDFAYAAAKYVAGDGPGDQGTSFHAGIQGVIGVGGIGAQSATFSATTRGELFVSDWNNWKPYLKTLALKYVQNGLLNVLGNGDSFNSIISAAYTGQISVSLGSPWFLEWQGIAPESLLPMPQNALAQSVNPDTPWHNYAGKGKKTINGQATIPIKSWQGHWLYMTQEVANAVFSLAGTGALTFNPAASRWWSLMGILMQRFPNIPISALLANHA